MTTHTIIVVRQLKKSGKKEKDELYESVSRKAAVVKMKVNTKMRP
jgi:hypothetical protein